MEISSQIILIILALLALGEAALFVLFARGWRMKGGKMGAPNDDVNAALERLASENKEARKDIQTLLRISRATSEIAEASISKVGLVRFNPFQGMGGDQSFSLALLDAKNNGFVITSIHANDATRIYAKPVEAGASGHQLSTEEQRAIEKALKKNV